MPPAISPRCERLAEFGAGSFVSRRKGEAMYLRKLLPLLMLIACVGPLQAQEREEGRRRGRGPRGPDPARMEERFDSIIARLNEELQLDEDQQAQLNEIAEAHRAKMRETGETWRAMRDAMREGDEQRAEELRAQLEETGRPWELFEDMLDEVEPMLDDEQHERFLEIRGEMEQRRERWRGRRERMERYREMTRELPDELGMDEEQRKQYEEFLGTWREQFRERMREARPLFDQMRQAREAGDEQRLEEIRNRLEEMRPDEDSLSSEFFDKVEELLRDDQKRVLTVYRAEMGMLERGQRADPGDIRVILAAARRVRLSDEQKKDLRAIRREAITEARKISRKDKVGQTRLANEVKKRILSILDEEQTGQFEENIEHYERRSRRR
jgi:hypothetical protein